MFLFLTVKSPKSIAFPSVDIVMNSIIFDFEPGLPPAKIPLVELPPPLIPFLASVKSPKSTIFPSCEIVTY